MNFAITDITSNQRGVILFTKSKLKFVALFIVALAFGNTNQANAQARVAGLSDPNLAPSGNTYFVIQDANDLITLNDWVTGNGTTGNVAYTCAGITFEVMANITGFTDVIGGAYWSASPFPFSGTFNGNGFTIILNGYFPQYHHSGLFAYLEGAVISDLKIDGVIIEGGSISLGGIAGYANESTIINCHNYASLSNIGGIVVGGIVGFAIKSNIISCSNDSSITRVFASVVIGGIVGYQEGGEILNCQNNAPLLYGYSDIGGICGISTKNGDIINCFNSSNSIVRGDGDNIGGIIGRLLDSDGIVRWNQNNGPVRGDVCVGGIIGNRDGGMPAILGNINTGIITGNAFVGGQVGCW